MKISCNAAHLIRRYGHDRAFALFKNAGFDAVDVSLEDMLRGDSPYNQDGYEAYAQAVRRSADAVGLEINQTHAPFGYPLDQWELRDDLIPILKRSLRISSIFGASVEVIHPYHHPEFLGHEDEMFQKNMDYYAQLLPTAQEVKVKIGVENMFREDPLRKYIVHDTCSQLDDFIRYVDTLNSSNAVACLDIGHTALTYQKEKPWDYIRGLGKNRLKALHVHDNNGINDQHLLPYEGRIDWMEVTKALGEIDYEGDFTFETHGNLKNFDDEFIPVRLKFMADVGRHLASLVDRNRP